MVMDKEMDRFFLLSMRTVLGSNEMTQLFFDLRVWQSHFALTVKKFKQKVLKKVRFVQL